LVFKATLLNAKARVDAILRLCRSTFIYLDYFRLTIPLHHVVGTAIDAKLGSEDITRVYMQLVGQDKAQSSADLSPIASLSRIALLYGGCEYVRVLAAVYSPELYLYLIERATLQDSLITEGPFVRRRSLSNNPWMHLWIIDIIGHTI